MLPSPAARRSEIELRCSTEERRTAAVSENSARPVRSEPRFSATTSSTSESIASICRASCGNSCANVPVNCSMLSTVLATWASLVATTPRMLSTVASMDVRSRLNVSPVVSGSRASRVA